MQATLLLLLTQHLLCLKEVGPASGGRRQAMTEGDQAFLWKLFFFFFVFLCTTLTDI
jgi:hypothetical protein